MEDRVIITVLHKTDYSCKLVGFKRISLQDINIVVPISYSTYKKRVARTVTLFGYTFKIPVFHTIKVPCPHYLVQFKNGRCLLTICNPLTYCEEVEREKMKNVEI